MSAQVFTRRAAAASAVRAIDARPAPRRPLSPAGRPAGCAEFHADAARIARARAAMASPPAAATLAETFRLLGDPTRVRLLDALAAGELCVCDLATLLGHTVSAVSHQLRLLRGLRLVRARRDGRMVFYSLDDHHIHDLLSQARRHVEERLAPRASRRGVSATS